MVGALRKVGDGKWPVAAVGDALVAKDRARSGPVAPPEGLYLLRVDY
jgi:tRNA pseudouridine38-40 synthase